MRVTRNGRILVLCFDVFSILIFEFIAELVVVMLHHDVVLLYVCAEWGFFFLLVNFKDCGLIILEMFR